MGHRKKRFLIWISIPVLILGLLGYLFFSHLFDPAFYKKILEEALSQAFEREVLVGRAKVNIWDGVGFSFEDFRIKDPPSDFDLLYSKRVILRVKLSRLLRGEVRWKRIVLDRPVLRLWRDREGRFNLWDDFLSGKNLRTSHQRTLQILSTLFGGSVLIRDGEVSFYDEGAGPAPLVTRIRALYFSLTDVSHGTPFPFRLSANIAHTHKEGTLVLSGTIQDIPEDMDLAKGTIAARLELRGLQTLHFWPYLKSLLPMERIVGELDATVRYQGSLGGRFKASANLKFKDLIFDYPKVFAYAIRSKWMNIELRVDYDQKDLKVSDLSVQLPELGLKVKGKLYGIGTKQMGIDAEAQSTAFDLSEAKKFIPFHIITRDVSESLFQSEGEGPFQILSVKLSGKMREIEHCDQPSHARILSVEARADGVRLRLPWGLPLLENLKGRLSYKDGHLYFTQTEGRVFHSRIHRAHGIFYQLLQTPTLEVNLEGKMELRDLVSFRKIKGLEGERATVLSEIQVDEGRADYRLFARAVLKPPLRFQHRGSYHLFKVRITHPQIPLPLLIGGASVDLSNEELKWSDARIDLGESSFLTEGSWRRGEPHPLKMRVRGKADLKDWSTFVRVPLFPQETRAKTAWIEEASGKADFLFQGEGDSNFQFAFYELEVIPRSVHLRMKGIPTAIAFREGAVSLSPDGVHFAKFRIQSRASFLTLNGTAKRGALDLTTRGSIDWKDLFPILQSPLSPLHVRAVLKGVEEISGLTEGHGRWEGREERGMALLKEAEVRLRGVSLKHSAFKEPLSSLEGTLVLSHEEIRLIELKGMIGSSPLSFSGTISRWREPEERLKGKRGFAVFQLSSPSFDLDLLLPKGEEGRSLSFEKLREWLSIWSLEGKVDAQKGRFRDLLFQDLKVNVKTDGEKLVFEPVQLKGMGGDLWGGGWIEPSEKGIRFEITPRISNMEAKPFLRLLLQKGKEERIMIRGRLHVDRASLRGEGSNFQEVKESLQGSLRIEAEDGVIEKWKIIARIFSLLNVSQLFWGRLPDLKAKGLPYRQILANVRIKDGVARTDDFVLESDAMRITLVGEIDLARNRIDATIGVHPLVTVDLILSHIPVAGYILTGKDKAFLSYVYEVKGDLDNPRIEAVPMKGLGKNLLGIIQRLLETPLRPFQKSPNSGERK